MSAGALGDITILALLLPVVVLPFALPVVVFLPKSKVVSILLGATVSGLWIVLILTLASLSK